MKEYEVLDEDRLKIKRPKARRLNSTKPKLVKKINTRFTNQMERNHVFERMEQLKVEKMIPLRMAQVVEYEKCDRFQHEGEIYAERKCRHLKMGEIPYVPEQVQIHGITVRFWTSVLLWKKGGRTSYRKIRNTAKFLGIDKPLMTSIPSIEKKRAEAWKKYRESVRDAPFTRPEWLKQKKNKLVEKGLLKQAKEVENLICQEESRSSHRNIKFAREKMNKQGTHKLTVPDGEDPSQLIEVTEKEDIEEILMQTNEKKFRSAEGTPLLQDDLYDKLGQRAMTEFGDRILRGEFEDESLDDGVKLFLKNAAIPKSILDSGIVSDEISPEDHRIYWRKARERTQSSMSGLDFSFYKTVTQDPRLNILTSRFINIPFATGFSPKRWKKSLNVHIMKEEGNYSPDKQRTIHLIEASLSEGAKIIFSKRMMQNARKCGVIPQDQYARKGGRSTEAALQKVLLYDYMRLTRVGGIVIANDMESCYDRMVHSATSLALRSLGASSTAVECMSSTIQNMTHYIRTAFGDSDCFYGGDEEDPLQGGGQGNPAAPPMWTALTIIFLRILQSLDPGVELITPISMMAVLFTAVYYVDDCDLFVRAKEGENAVDMCRRMQKLLRFWCSLLWASGGALRPKKCWWCCISFRWKGSRWRFAREDEVPFTMVVKDGRGEEQPIKRCSPHDAERTLGVWCAPDGRWNVQIEKLKEASKVWAEQMRTSWLNKHEAFISLNTTISKTWLYPLAVTSIPLKKCNEIMVPAYRSILPKMGICRTLPLEIRFGPSHLLGLGLINIYTAQGAEHIKMLLTHMKTNSKIGYTMLAFLEESNLEIGISSHLFHTSFTKYGFLLGDSWMKSTWEFVDKYDIHIKGEYSRPQLQRQNDKVLMEMVIEDDRKLFTKQEILSINRCRCFLQVVFLSDICDSSGRGIEEWVKTGEEKFRRKSKWIWPVQIKPDRKEWDIFVRCLDLVWTRHSRFCTVEPCLGKWIQRPHQVWEFWLDPSKSKIYHAKGDKYVVYKKWDYYQRDLRSRRATYKMWYQNITYLPLGCKRVSVWEDDGPGVIRAGDICEDSVPANNCPKHDKLLENIIFGAEKEQIKEVLRKNELVISTDGSFCPKTKIATAAIRLEDSSSNSTLAIGWCRVPGPNELMEAYRAELIGLLLALKVLETIFDTVGLPNGISEISCDNDSALDKGIASPWQHMIRMKHYDVLWELNALKKKLPVQFRPIRVKGHSSLSAGIKCQRIRMNQWVDKVAGDYATFCKENEESTRIDDFESERWSLWYDGKKIVKDIDFSLKEVIDGQELMRYYFRKRKLDKESVKWVNWTALKRARRQMATSTKLWTVKFSCNFCAVGSVMKQRKQWKEDTCVLCKQETESTEHILRCTATRDFRAEQLLDFAKWMDGMKTDPRIKSIFISAMLFQDGFVQNCADMGEEDVGKAAEEQDYIGQFGFYNGLISNRWAAIQTEYYRKEPNTKKRSGDVWAAELIKRLAEYTYAVWKKRSELVHHELHKQQAEKKTECLNAQIADNFERWKGQIRARDNYIFDLELLDVLLMENDRKELWVDMVLIAIECAVHHRSREELLLQLAMERWTAGKVRRIR